MCLPVCRCATQMRCPPLSAAWCLGVLECQKPLAKQRQRALTPVRMADVHTTRQGGTWGHGTGQRWLVQAVPSGHGRKQTEALLPWVVGCIQHNSMSHQLRSTLKADKIYHELKMMLVLRKAHVCVYITSYFFRNEEFLAKWSHPSLIPFSNQN